MIPPAAPSTAGPGATSRLGFVLAVIATVILASWIGSVQFRLGPGKVVLQPQMWALIAAACWGLAYRVLPRALAVSPSMQAWSAVLLDAALVPFVVKLGLTVGGAGQRLAGVGWGLLFQELGHVFGTLALGLPLAILLGIKREAVGATFSIGREGSMLIIGDRYGMASPEGRGVLAEFITGTVLGAVFIAVLAGFVTQLHVFDPRSLAMGAGVGSASMMAAAMGAIGDGQPHELLQDLLAIAAASNLLSSIGGYYMALFVSLPVASWLYDRLEPVIGRFGRGVAPAPAATAQFPIAAAAAGPGPPPAASPHRRRAIRPRPPLRDAMVAWAIVAISVAIGSAMLWGVPVVTSLTGSAIVIGICALAEALRRVLPRVPIALTQAILTTLIGLPGVSPLPRTLLDSVAQVNFLAFATPVLALAGFSLAKDMPLFRRLGWRILVVSLTAMAGSFLGGTLIAESFYRRD